MYVAIRADVLWLRVGANYNMIIVRVPSGFHEKCAEFASRRLEIIEKSISYLRNAYRGWIRKGQGRIRAIFGP